VKQFSWDRGKLVLDGNFTLNGQTTSWGPAAKEVKMFLGDNCPPGWEEVPQAAGYMLVSRPTGGVSGNKLNTPFANNESTRVPPHVHAAVVADPGHAHSYRATGYAYLGGGNTGFSIGNSGYMFANSIDTPSSTTGVTVGINSPTNASHNPQLYVLLCQAAGV